MRTSVSRDPVTATVCTEELFLSSQYIDLPVYQMVNHLGWEGYRRFNTIHLGGGGSQSFCKTRYFCTIILWPRKTIKLFFHSRQYSLTWKFWSGYTLTLKYSDSVTFQKDKLPRTKRLTPAVVPRLRQKWFLHGRPDRWHQYTPKQSPVGIYCLAKTENLSIKKLSLGQILRSNCH